MSERGKGQLVKEETEEEEIKRLLLGIMEGYNDTVIPPLSYFSPSPGISITERSSSSVKGQKNEASWAESLRKDRKRREQMSEKFSVLQSMVPTLFNAVKPSKEKIITDTGNYIKYLEEETERLEGLKKFQLEDPKVAKTVLLKCANQNSPAHITVSNAATFFTVQRPFRRRLVTEIVKVFEKHGAEVLEARVCVNDHWLLTFTATIILGHDGSSTIDKIREEVLTL